MIGAPDEYSVPDVPRLPDLAPTRSAALCAGVFVAAYLALDWVSYIHPLQQYSVTPWNPQPALAIALLMLGGQRWVVVVFTGVVVAEGLVRGATASWPATLLIATVISLCYAAMARALTGRFAIHPGLDSRRDAIRLVAVVAIGALATGTLYVAALLAGGAEPLDAPLIALVRFWIGDAVGILVTLPLVFMLVVPARRSELHRMVSRPEMAAHAVITAIALASVFTLPDAEQVKVCYVLFMPLIVIATRHGLVGATVAMLVIQAAIIVTGEVAAYQTLTMFELQGLLIALTVTGLFLGVTVDERRRAEAAVVRSGRMAAAGEMAAALAHEVNQPLTALGSYARAVRLMVSSGNPDPRLLADTLDKLVAEASRAADVVRRLRDFFRSGTTRLASMELEAAVVRVVASLNDSARASRVAVSVATDPAIGPVHGDATQLEVVLRNLVANAIEAASAAAPGEVSVHVGRDAAGTPRISVRDSGPGVGPSDVARIFEPFETTRATGMGIGLTVSRAIVEAHGGRLWVEPGTHGLFILTLPQEGTHD